MIYKKQILSSFRYGIINNVKRIRKLKKNEPAFIFNFQKIHLTNCKKYAIIIIVKKERSCLLWQDKQNPIRSV